MPMASIFSLVKSVEGAFTSCSMGASGRLVTTVSKEESETAVVSSAGAASTARVLVADGVGVIVGIAVGDGVGLGNGVGVGKGASPFIIKSPKVAST